MKPRIHASLLAVVLTFFCVASADAAGLLIPQGQSTSLDYLELRKLLYLSRRAKCVF